mmetsp:Transcript_49559/g.131005  ORF Transcript_49559/g.131005 Transcript_49559/m.131005 type:complete len:96 (-) Transcript_49559:325-612(-)
MGEAVIAAAAAAWASSSVMRMTDKLVVPLPVLLLAKAGYTGETVSFLALPESSVKDLDLPAALLALILSCHEDPLDACSCTVELTVDVNRPKECA